MPNYNVVVAVNFELEVDAATEYDARELAENELAEHLAPWDMPDHYVFETLAYEQDQ